MSRRSRFRLLNFEIPVRRGENLMSRRGSSNVLKSAVFVTLMGALVLAACAAPTPDTIVVTRIVEGESVEVEVTREVLVDPTSDPGIDPRRTALFIGVSNEPQTFDPAVNVAAVSGYRFYPSVYESLIQWAPDGTLEPMLAESWEASDDGLTYRFNLREDVKFSDGTAFNAQAVEAAFDRFFTLGLGFISLFSSIEEVEVIDEFTVDLHLSQPFAPILSVLASWQSAIFVSPTAVAVNEIDGDLSQGWLHDNTAGTGPYTLDVWEPENRIVLVRNPHYREAAAPDSIQSVVYQAVGEPATLRQLLEAGDLDIAHEIQPSLIEPLTQADGVNVGIEVTHGSSYGQEVYLNLTKEPFSDVNFRRALAYAIDYDRLLPVWEGIASAAQGPLPATFAPWFSPEDAIQYEQDLDKSAELLAEAGFSVPIDPPLEFQIFWQGGQTAQRDMAVLLKEDFAPLGIDLEVQETPIPVWRDAIWNKEFNFAFIQLPLRYNDPDSFASLVLESSQIGGTGFNPGFSNARVDELIEEARTETDPEKRREMYNELQRIVTDEVAMLFLVNKLHAFAFGSNVTGIVWNSNYGPHYVANDIRIAAER